MLARRHGLLLLCIPVLVSAQSPESLDAQGRRLWGFQWPWGVPDAKKLEEEVGSIIGNAGNAIGGAVGGATGGFSAFQETFGKSKDLVQEGLKVVTNAVSASSQFSADMGSLYQRFKPLEPVFAAQHGVFALLTSRQYLKILIHFLIGLLRSALELSSIGRAVGAVSRVFTQLFGLFDEQLQKLKPGGEPGGRRLLPGYTALLDGLDFKALNRSFADFEARAEDYVRRTEHINATIHPLLQDLEARLGERRLEEEGNVSRRLSIEAVRGGLKDIEEDQKGYQEAILSVVPTWQSVETLAIDVCGKTDGAMRQMSSLHCRLDGFASKLSLPGTSDVPEMVRVCDETSARSSQRAKCPGEAQSAGVRDMLSEHSGFLGWLCVTFEYTIKHSVVAQVTLGLLCLLVGMGLAFLGYRYKDCEFWVQGCAAGLVLWSIVFSVLIVWFGVCRGFIFDSCEPPWLFLLIALLSIACAFGSTMTSKAQLFLAGFDLGAILGACCFVWQFHEPIFSTFVSVDGEKARLVFAAFLGAAIVCGLIMGCLVVAAERHAIIMGTAAIGGFLMVASISIFSPHWLGWWDLIGWLLLTALGAAVQYLVTARKAEGSQRSKEEGKEEEMAPLFGGCMSD